MHNRRARPTLRVLLDDLTSDWASPRPQRHLQDKQYDDLLPLSELPHPIVTKAAESFGNDPADDNFVGQIASATRIRLLEIRSAQWRGAVWEDPDSGVCWLVAAGLAKGEHRDRDDFYENVKRANSSGGLGRWLPTSEDQRLLKRETAARLLRNWEITVQRQVLEALRVIHNGGTHSIEVSDPGNAAQPLAVVELTVTAVREEGYEADEILLDLRTADGAVGSNREWQLTTRLLITLDPPVQEWDRYANTYSNIAEPGAWTSRIAELDELAEAGDLAISELGASSHYVHARDLATKTIEGRSVRAMCGVYFVPMQDHESKPKCDVCAARYAELPQ